MAHEGDSESEADDEAENDSDVSENETPAEAEEEGEDSCSWGFGRLLKKRAEAFPLSEKSYPSKLLPCVEFSGIHISPEFTYFVHLKALKTK